MMVASRHCPWRARLRGLYLVTPDWEDTDRLLAVTAAAIAGGAAVVQYRNKTADRHTRRTQAQALKALCERTGRPFVVNDHVDLCVEVEADGVHLGHENMSLAAARAILGPARMIGISCYGNIELALQAQANGATYVALGGFFPSTIKAYPVTTSIETLRLTAACVDIPIATIGGMSCANAPPLVAAGASMIAAISDIYCAPDPAAAAGALAGLFRR